MSEQPENHGEPTVERPYIGGQAVIEGVMMRAPSSFAIVVRRQDGSLHVRERPITDPRQGYERWPLFRGVASLVESLKLGGESMRFAMEQYERDFEAAEASKKSAMATSVLGNLLAAFKGVGVSLFSLATAADGEAVQSEGKGSGMSKLMLGFMVLVMVLLPQAAASGANSLLGLGWDLQSSAFQMLTGGFKLTIVIGYMMLLRRQRDVRRMFQYHGAEHKTISTYEAREELTVENARKHTTLHPRCGTTFLVMIALVSVIMFTVLGAVLPRIDTGNSKLDFLVFFVLKLPLIPVIAAITFEIQRVFARYFTKGPLRVVLWPGFLVQKVTTIEPDDDQLEVALASLRVTLFRESGKASEAHDDVRFAGYADLMASPELRPR